MERALGIVLVRAGRAEDGHDRVANELLDEPVVALDRSRELPEQVALEGADLLRVERLRERGEPRQVREQDGDQPPVALLGPSGGRSGTRARGLSGGGRAARPPTRAARPPACPHTSGRRRSRPGRSDPHPGQVIGCHSLLHVAGRPQRGVASCRERARGRRASRGRAGLCTIGLHRVPHRHEPLKEIAPRCCPTPWVTCSTSPSVSRPRRSRSSRATRPSPTRISTAGATAPRTRSQAWACARATASPSCSRTTGGSCRRSWAPCGSAPSPFP